MSKPRILKSWLIACSVASLTTALLLGCSSGSSSSSTGTVQDYSGPGSKWDINLAIDGTFNIDHYLAAGDANTDYTVQGTYTRQSNGFVSLTVTGGNGTGGPNTGEKAWAIEIPGYAFMLKPVSGDQLVAMVNAGECPTADFNANWVMVKTEDYTAAATTNHDGTTNAGADQTSIDFFGTFSYDFANNTPSLPKLFPLAQTNGAFVNSGPDNTLPAGTCSNGIMSLTGTTMYLTSNGGAIVHTGVNTPGDTTDDSFIFALSQKAITNVNSLDGNYAGMLFDSSNTAGQQIIPVTFSCTSGSCAGAVVSNVETGALAAGMTAAVELTGTVDGLANGFITGTIAYAGSSATGNLACMADIDALGTGKKIISCVGQSANDNAEMFNVIFVSN